MAIAGVRLNGFSCYVQKMPQKCEDGIPIYIEILTANMQNLSPDTVSQNYFAYLPENRLCAAWGCTVTALGHTRIRAGSSYPPRRHPDDHHFTWESGRIIDAFQIVQITRGRGSFESARTQGPQLIQAGNLFLLFPSVWHRYAPDRGTGWTEHWVECRGHAFDAALATGVLNPGHPIQPANQDLAHVFNEIHAWAKRDPLANQGVISTLGLQLLALLLREATPDHTSQEEMLVQRAMMLMLERCHEPLNLPHLARELNLGYTRFREMFKAHAHTSPKQYHLRIRLNRARDLLRNTDKPLKEIAHLLGFHSAFHFSSQFRTSQGLSPRAWRQHARATRPAGVHRLDL
jgi:AraC-like DNA-binding protein